MPGLPFQSLPAAGEIGGPAFEMTDAQGNVTQAGIMQRDPRTGLAEPFYGDLGGGTGQQNITQTDPVDLATWQGEQELGQLAIFDRQLAQVKAPIQRELDISYKQYQIDVNAIRNSGLEQDQQRSRINQMNATYQKKWVTIQGKLEPQVQAVTQAKDNARRGMVLNQALRMKEIQTYASLAEQGVMNEDVARSLQYKALGYEVPVTAFRPPKRQDPYRAVQELRSVLELTKRRMQSFRTQVHDPSWKPFDASDRLFMLKPGGDPKKKGDWELAGPEQEQEYGALQQQYGEAQTALDAASSQLIGKRVTDLNGAAGSMAHDVRQSKPRQHSSTGRGFRPGEMDAIWQEAGGDPEQATQIARARGIRVED
ncbi:MAG: hypothetical protein GY832_31560 [Chloroflexi bacterium]|nr:hypothetical protein [Chloroflexota bacterium]